MSSITADPAKTWALVVGVGEYSNATWNTEGPAEAALDFVDFLKTERGLDEARMEVLISAAAGAQGHTGPTRQEVGRSLERLRDASGELLIVFWSGHGVIDIDRQQRLFYADASQRSPLNLNFEALKIALASQWCQGFRQQLLIVDACAVDMGRYFKFEVPGDVFEKHSPVDTRQAVLFASRELKTAKPGLFWGVLRERLEAAAAADHQGAWPDLELMLDQVQSTFEGRAENQQPRLFLSGWSGRGGISTLASSGIAHLNREQRAALEKLLAKAPLGEDERYRIYVEALRVAGMAGQARDDIVGDAERLGHLSVCDSPLPLLALPLGFAAAANDGRVAAELRDWAAAAAERLGVERTRMKELARGFAADKPEAATLLIVIRDGGSQGYLATAWLWQRGAYGDEPEYPKEQGDAEGPLSVEELRTEIPKLVFRVRRALPSETRLAVEMMVPVALLHQDFDAWSAAKGPLAPPSSPIGTSYPVVVRSLERVEDTTYHDSWQPKWRALREHPAAKPAESARWIRPGALEPDALYKQLDASDDYCVGLVFAPGSDEPWLSYTVAAGVPVVLWLRRQPADPSAEEERLCAELGEATIEELPEWILAARKRGHAAAPTDPLRHLSLLWDDFDRQLPPRPSELGGGG